MGCLVCGNEFFYLVARDEDRGCEFDVSSNSVLTYLGDLLTAQVFLVVS